jgi:hypothetical protein
MVVILSILARDMSLQNISKLHGKIDALLLQDLSEFEEGRPLTFDVHRPAAHPLSRHASFLSAQPLSCGLLHHLCLISPPLLSLSSSFARASLLDRISTSPLRRSSFHFADCSLMSRRYPFLARLDMEDEEMPGPEVSAAFC